MMDELLTNMHNVLSVWAVSRAAGLTSYLLLFISVVTGMSIHYSFVQPRAKSIMNQLHQSAGWFGILLGTTHGLVLVFSTYESFSIWNVLIPFTSDTHPVLIGLGTLTLYTMILLVVTSDYMRAIGKKTWKAIHYLALPALIAAFFHGMLLGPDTHEPLVLSLYISTAGITILAFICRVSIRPQKQITSRRQEQKHQN